ncbi:uncharacterized protein LOC103724100 [Phoenix dactylifera]|uniref:Uncharacterized protein LOC103724100 n=1 Tax=Phoenix dactylifera TaxID=42345 RepID=A0A8B7D560_PHODC|nr:uncharacterized protein LOC103724100 [Phoenix dactylifera]
MAFRAVMRSVRSSAPRRPFHRPNLSSFASTLLLTSKLRISLFHGAAPLGRSNGDTPSLAAPSSAPQEDQDPSHEANSESSKSEGRVAQTANIFVIGGTLTDDAANEWLVLDQKVNTYPMFRGFTAIGTGGDDFVQAMVSAVVSVLQRPILEEQVTQRLSSRRKYVSVNIGPIRVCSVEEVQAVYSVMRRDDRTRFLL